MKVVKNKFGESLFVFVVFARKTNGTESSVGYRTQWAASLDEATGKVYQDFKKDKPRKEGWFNWYVDGEVIPIPDSATLSNCP